MREQLVGEKQKLKRFDIKFGISVSSLKVGLSQARTRLINSLFKTFNKLLKDPDCIWLLTACVALQYMNSWRRDKDKKKLHLLYQYMYCKPSQAYKSHKKLQAFRKTFTRCSQIYRELAKAWLTNAWLAFYQPTESL